MKQLFLQSLSQASYVPMAPSVERWAEKAENFGPILMMGKERNHYIGYQLTKVPPLRRAACNYNIDFRETFTDCEENQEIATKIKNQKYCKFLNGSFQADTRYREAYRPTSQQTSRRLERPSFPDQDTKSSRTMGCDDRLGATQSQTQEEHAGRCAMGAARANETLIRPSTQQTRALKYDYLASLYGTDFKNPPPRMTRRAVTNETSRPKGRPSSTPAVLRSSVKSET